MVRRAASGSVERHRARTRAANDKRRDRARIHAVIRTTINAAMRPTHAARTTRARHGVTCVVGAAVASDWARSPRRFLPNKPITAPFPSVGLVSRHVSCGQIARRPPVRDCRRCADWWRGELPVPASTQPKGTDIGLFFFLFSFHHKRSRRSRARLSPGRLLCGAADVCALFVSLFFSRCAVVAFHHARGDLAAWAVERPPTGRAPAEPLRRPFLSFFRASQEKRRRCAW